MIPAAAWLAILLVYMALPTRDFYWDGVSFAIRIEKAAFDSRLLFHPNHLLYEALGYGLYTLAGWAGIPVRALFLLQGLDAVAASLCVLIIYFLVQERLGPGSHSLSLAALFAFSGSWWRFGSDADAYVLSILFISLAYRLLSSRHPTHPFAAGLLHSCGMLFHQLAVFFFPVAVTCLWRQEQGGFRRKIRAVVEYSVLSAGVTLAAYWYIFQKFIFHRVEPSPAGLFAWMTEHSENSGFSFRFGHNAALTLAGTLRLFFTGQLKLVRAGFVAKAPLELAALILLAVAGVLLIWDCASLIRARDPLHSTERQAVWQDDLPLRVWVGIYVAFLFFWMPQNTFYRLFYLPPLILLASGFFQRSWPGNNPRDGRMRLLPASLAGLLAVSLFLWNFAFSIYPRSRPEQNPVLQFALEQNAAWPAGTGVAFRQFHPDLWTVCYFNPQAAWIGLGASDTATLEYHRQRLSQDHLSLWLEGTAYDDLSQTLEGKHWLGAYLDGSSTMDRSVEGRRFRFYRVIPP